jgi:MoxR-like ATPase
MCCGSTNWCARCRSRKTWCVTPCGWPPPRARNKLGSPAFVNDWVSWGAGTRAAQFLTLGAKARALLHGRTHVTAEDIRTLAAPVLRHRILVNYRAEAEGTNVDAVIRRLLETVSEPGAS